MADLTHQRCPYTHCGSSDAFSYKENEGVGYCHSCSTPYPSTKPVFPWAEKEYPKPEKKMSVKQIEVVKSTYEGIRGLDPEVAKIYGIQLQLGEGDVPVRYAFKHPDNVKYRGYDEKVFWVKDKGVTMDNLFGPEFQAAGKRLYLTEGEFDAASLYQTLGKTYPVKSLPSAAISEKFIKKNIDYIKSFQEVVYAGELDDAGKRAAEKLYAAIPEKFYYVPLTKWKDANEFIMNGDTELLKWAALKPQRYSPDNFFCTDDAVEKALREENPYEYVPTGHTGWDEKSRGLVKGGITFIKAPRGTGKTELIRYFETAMLKDDDTRIALLHAEEMKSTTYRAMATYHLGSNVRTKDDAKWNNISEEEVIVAAKEATKGERTIIFEMRAGDDPMKILEYVRLAATVYGADFIFVDHIQRLAYLSANGVDGATSMLTALGSRMAQLCKELNIGVIFISQVNDDGRTKYAAALEEEAIICVLLERDGESEDEIEQNTTRFNFDKNRPFSKLGLAGAVYYDPDSTILTEVPD
jgi:twinkle protein